MRTRTVGAGLNCKQCGHGRSRCLPSAVQCLRLATNHEREARGFSNFCHTQKSPAKVVCRAVAGGKLYIDPVLQQSSAFAPATIANLGPGFDWMGCAVEVGDHRFFHANARPCIRQDEHTCLSCSSSSHQCYLQEHVNQDTHYLTRCRHQLND